jgi:hypothetical protein
MYYSLVIPNLQYIVQSSMFLNFEPWFFRHFCGYILVPLFGKEGSGEILRKHLFLKSPLAPLCQRGGVYPYNTQKNVEP